MSAGCPACGFLNPGDAVYCGRCGGTLGPTCSSCGFGPLPAGLAYCTACGAEIESPEVALERKIVSVVFVDIVGFTSLAEKLDPEDVRRIIDPYYVCVRQELERYGGTVEKFIGDAAMALFGAPIAHEDDAERAVRAAHAVREAVGRLHDDEGSPRLQIRIGIATGEAVVTLNARPDEGTAMAHGDVVNTAARIQAAAPVDGILVNERTYRGTRFQVDYRPGPQIQAKGKTKPVPVWEVVAPRGRTGTERFRHPRPLVGREPELGVLAQMLDDVVARREPRLATLAGPPGIGKSRLVWELFLRVERGAEMIFWRQGRCLPYGDGVTFWALAEIVKGHAGILATDPPATVESKLRLAVEDVVPDLNDARWIEAHLAPLAGLTPANELRGDHRTEAFAAWRRFFEAIAARSPLVLVFEDLHWADDGLLEFVSGVLGERFWGPLLVVATCRPELLERETGWGAGRSGATTLELDPLSNDETARLVADLLEAPNLPPELRSALLSGAGGNPLYAEEYVRMLVDRGLLRTDGAALELAGPALPLPESVQAIVAARLDALPADEKTLVQAAAVVGRAFWLGALSAIEEQPRWSVEHRLHELEGKQLVRRERDSIVLTEPQFSFSHAVVRDVAYEQIPRSLRVARHSRAARWLEALSPERSEDRAEMLAHHYLSALRYMPVPERERNELIDSARVALREAGDRSLSLNAFAKAAEFYGEALTLWPPSAVGHDDLILELGRARLHSESGGGALLEEARDAFLAHERPEKAAEAMVLIGELQWMEGDPTAFGTLEDAAALLQEGSASPAKAHVLSSLARFRTIGDENEKAIEVGLEALAMADELGITEVRAHALDSIGRARVRIGDPRGFENLEESITIAVDSNSLESVRGYANLGNALVEAGDLARAFELYEEGRTAARLFGDVDRIRWFEAERVYECYWRGRWDEAVRLADDVVAQADAGFPTAFEQDALLVRGRIRLAGDDPDAALADSSRALQLGRRGGYPEMLVPALALHVRMLEAAGNRGEAESHVDELLSIWPERCPASYWLADLGFALDGLGRPQRLLDAAEDARTPSKWLDAARAVAEGDYGRAADVYAAVGSLPDELVSRLGAARQAAGLGLRAEAEAGLAQLLPALERIGASRYAGDGELLRAALADPPN
jgi:class 3 adenylate cyclase/tetratricopeptide (TPR) repeat protein